MNTICIDRRKRIFIDMDGVLVDFQSGIDQQSEEILKEYEERVDEIPGLFLNMRPMPGAIEAVHVLQKYFDLYILTTAPWKNPTAASDKVLWVRKYLDDVFHKRMIITHCKNLCIGDYLIDDRGKNGTSDFTGEWIEFGNSRFPDWLEVAAYLLKEENLTENIANDAVGLLVDYTDFHIDNNLFFRDFTFISNLAKKFYEDIPEWLKHIIEVFEITSSEKADYDNDYIYETEFGAFVMAKLQKLKDEGCYIGLIKNYYSKVLL